MPSTEILILSMPAWRDLLSVPDDEPYAAISLGKLLQHLPAHKAGCPREQNEARHTISSIGTAVTNFVPRSARLAFPFLISAAMFQGRISR
jgi:hypothetical protein